jgi:hypothetical protein
MLLLHTRDIASAETVCRACLMAFAQAIRQADPLANTPVRRGSAHCRSDANRAMSVSPHSAYGGPIGRRPISRTVCVSA